MAELGIHQNLYRSPICIFHKISLRLSTKTKSLDVFVGFSIESFLRVSS